MPDAPKPRPESRRLRAAALFVKGKGYLEVARTMGVSPEAARKWRLRWEEGGREGLKDRHDVKRGRKPPISDPQTHALMKRARELKVTTLAGLVELAGKQKLDVSRSALRRRLIALGYWEAGKAD
jgi:transposase